MLIELIPQPLLALDIGSIIFFLFLLFSFFGFISNLIKGNAGNQQQARGRQPRRGGELQNEIDDFLKEVLGDQPAQKRPQQRAQVEFVDEDLEVIEDEEVSRRLQQEERERQVRERRQREQEQRKQEERDRRERERRKQEADRKRREQRKRKQPAAPVLFEETSAKPQKTLKDRHIESTLGSHVKSYMSHDITNQKLERGTVDPIEGRNLADYSDQSGVDQSSHIAQTLHRILKSPQGVRQAILVNEILSKPKSMRSDSA